MRLQQVVCNLVGNAVKFTAKGSVLLSIRAEPSNDFGTGTGAQRFRFEISDTGIGIAADSLGRIFEPFVQAESSTSRRYGGSGLGLTIVDRLVEAMSGELCRVDLARRRAASRDLQFQARAAAGGNLRDPLAQQAA